jgi:hypothetical protein
MSPFAILLSIINSKQRERTTFFTSFTCLLIFFISSFCLCYNTYSNDLCTPLWNATIQSTMSSTSSPRPSALQKQRALVLTPPTQSYTPPNQQWYTPSIYRYKCYGVFAASNDRKVPHHTCWGIASRLQHLSDWETHTRNGAVQEFTSTGDRTEYTVFEMDDDDDANLPPAASSSSPTTKSTTSSTTKSIVLSPAVIYKDTSPHAEPPLPEEARIQRQIWKCYGSTEVEYLLLTPVQPTSITTTTTPQQQQQQQQHHIAAIAPTCTTGVSYRDLWTDDNDSAIVVSVSIGPLTIVGGGVLKNPKNEPLQDSHLHPKHASPPDRTTTTTDAVPSKNAWSDTVRLYRKVKRRMYRTTRRMVRKVSHPDFVPHVVTTGHKTLHHMPIMVQLANDTVVQAYYYWKHKFNGGGSDRNE